MKSFLKNDELELIDNEAIFQECDISYNQDLECHSGYKSPEKIDESELEERSTTRFNFED